MQNRQPIDPARALDQLFQVIRQEALGNPAFARRLLDAVGHPVQFRGEEALAAVDPILVAMQGPEEFRRTFLSMKLADVKRVGTASGLLVPKERLPATIGALVDLLWERAEERMGDVFPRRHAAE